MDFDNDGWKDLFVGQGHVMDTISIDFPQISYQQKLMLLRNLQGRFTDISGKAGVPFQAPLAARGAAFGDIDNDGRVDVVVSTNDGSPHILMNRSQTRGHWIEVKLKAPAATGTASEHASESLPARPLAVWLCLYGLELSFSERCPSAFWARRCCSGPRDRSKLAKRTCAEVIKRSRESGDCDH